MKNSTLLKPLLLFTLSLLFISSSLANSMGSEMVPPLNGDDEIGPVRVNWANYMLVTDSSNAVVGAGTFIFLDSLDNLNVGIGVNTTDNRVHLYPSLYIVYEFNSQTDTIGPITQNDLIYNATTGLFESSQYETFNHSTHCDARPASIFDLEVSIKLLTLNSSNDLVSYPISSHPNLFDPDQLDNLNDGMSGTKNLVCHGGIVPGEEEGEGGDGGGALVNNNHSGQALTDKTNDTPTTATTTTTTSSPFTSSNQQPTDQTNIMVNPNPFVDEFTIQYHLDSPSNVEIKIFDITGQQLLARRLGTQTEGLHQQQLLLDEHIASGLCIVQIYFLDMVRTVKLVKL